MSKRDNDSLNIAEFLFIIALPFMFIKGILDILCSIFNSSQQSSAENEYKERLKSMRELLRLDVQERYNTLCNKRAMLIPDDKIVLPDLIVVVGQDAPEHTPALIGILKQYPEIFARVRAAVRQEDQRWDLILNDASDGLVVALPEIGIEAALSRLMTPNAQVHLLSKDLQRIDIRYADRLISQPRRAEKKIEDTATKTKE